jgi:hypothetical protein
VAFDLVSPTANVSLPVPPYIIQNFISSNKHKVMILGLNYVALQIMRDSSQIITVPEFPLVLLTISSAIALAMVATKTKRPRRRKANYRT